MTTQTEMSDFTDAFARTAPAWIIGTVALAVAVYAYLVWGKTMLAVMVASVAVATVGYGAVQTRQYIRTKRLKR